MSRSGAELALLLLGSYRNLVDEVVVELAARGFPDTRPSHDYALRAIDAGADNASELGRRLAVSKQAAAKTVEVLEARGYVTRASDPADARRKRLEVTTRGRELLRVGEAVFDDVRARLERDLGARQLAQLERQLATMVGDRPIRLDSPGWASQELA